MAARLTLYNSGIQRLLQSPQMEAGVRVHAERLKRVAESVSPVGSPPEDEHPGLYQRSWKIDTGRWRVLSPRYGPHPIVEITVYNDAPHALALEFGTKHMAAQHVAQKAIDAARLA
ncbi:HK97 gp10 family phage protein [Streptodolium elevatio]|uniref:HK97 gp10 family phage protein n=1 Tax=Streptodolium elevatio TaxID=3157996 RepID=A0ABV3DLL9_9ACTN